MIKVTDEFIAPSRGTVADVMAFFETNPPARLLDSMEIIERVYDLCEAAHMDFSLAVSRIADETGSLNGPSFFVSEIYRERMNIGGLGVTDGDDEGISFTDPIESADAYWAHLATYILGSNYNVLGVTPADDPRFDATPVAWRGSVKTLDDLRGKWFTNPDGAVNSAARGNRIFKNLPDQSTSTVPPPPGGELPVATKPYVLLVAGHRSYNDAGNPAEKNLTDDLARIYTAAFRAAGYKADWWQRDLDKDADPDDTVGGLDTVALGCARHLSGVAGPKALLDLHFNGSHSPVHAIVPDSRGLRTAYANGSPDDDAYANNVLDRAFAAKWAQDVAKAFGLGLFNGDAVEPGVMLEGETGVGLDGFRLATMAASAGNRNDTIRTVLEHAGTDDWGGNQEAKFQRVAAIAVATMNAVYKVTDIATPPVDPKYTVPSLPSWWDAVIAANYPTNQDLNGAKFLACKKRVHVKKATVQRATASAKGARSGEDLAAGTPVDILGEFKGGSGTKYVLAAGSDNIARGARIRMADLDELISITER